MMPPTQQREDNKAVEQSRRDTLKSLIEEKVFHALGKPRELLKLQVRSLWENHYRVNVLVGKDAASAHIANSFFLTADGDGNIVASTPNITKQY